MKELVSSLVQKARDELLALSASEFRLRETHNEILARACTLGSHLCELKTAVGRGNWLLFLPAALPELGRTDSARTENASRCMRFFKDNPPKIGNSRFLKPPTEFSPDSKRKFLWNYVPAKERLQLAGDEKVNFSPSYLTSINEYFKWRHQVKIGHSELPPMDMMRFDFKPVICDLMELLGPEWVSKLCS